MFLNLFFRNFAAINMVKYSNMKSNLYNKTYSNIPLSVLYKQFIRFMKENGIYTLYLEISFPKTKMSYETFSKNIFKLGQCTSRPFDWLFLQFSMVGPNYARYGIYGNSVGVWGSAHNFLKEINKKWRSFLLGLDSLYCTEKN